MNLSDEKVSEAIATLMGICWHEWMIGGVNTLSTCSCGNTGYPVRETCSRDNFSSFTPDGVFAWKAYMEKELPEEWRRWLQNIFADHGNCGFNLPNKLNDVLNAHHLVRYLYENLDRWGYENCIGCRSGYVTDNELCQNCEGTGKVLTEKARKFKTIIETSQKEEVK
jgi:hypothetical protein